MRGPPTMQWWARQGSPLQSFASAAPLHGAVGRLHPCGSAQVTGVAALPSSVSPHASGVAHWPGPPGALGAFISLWQQTNPASDVPSTPAVHGHPTPMQGVGVEVGLGPSGSQPTDDGVQLPARRELRWPQ